MSAVYDPSVKLVLWRYEQTLIKQGSVYNVSRKRRLEKLCRLRNYLQSLGNTSSDSFQVCDKIELGQIIVNGVCLDPTLKITYYKDESDTQWSISFFRISAKVVRIHRLKQTSGVDESITPKKKFIRLTESELKRVISESVSQILQEDYEGYKNYAEYAKYRPIGKKKFQTKYGNEIESVVTLRSGSGQMCHIVEDDHCYVLYDQLSFEDEAAPVTHIFPDAFEILKKLPNPL